MRAMMKAVVMARWTGVGTASRTRLQRTDSGKSPAASADIAKRPQQISRFTALPKWHGQMAVAMLKFMML
ncbi:hypothetical protein A0J57_24840 [Sphingobium sp. 22B]|nr:hypothetical protein AXW74_24485 [Sphingobium sp. AM]KYC29644.1 hypothetical protein A0J57_24840 [Sphingobium sp. 22B]OAP29545.1 hypothetical protein A8O16_23015 [Sphingobium sp. 20006FA]